MTETIKIGNYDVSKDDVWLYIQHFERDKSDLSQWEQDRKMYHDNVFKNLGIDRFSDEGREFSESFDTFCEPHINDKMVVALKRLNRDEPDAKSDVEREVMMAQVKARKEMYMIEQGFSEPDATDEERNTCRMCNKDLAEGVPRVNDNYANLVGFTKPKSPICSECSDKNPDDYHIKFKETYWSKK